MPFRDKSRPEVWRGQVKVRGKMYRADFATRREAVAWEAEKRKELMKPPEEEIEKKTVMGLLEFFNRYLDHCELRYVRKVFKEKKKLCEALVARWGNTPAEEVSPAMVNDYLQERAQKRSANAHNKDRKNLLAMWSWGQKILDLQSNPVAKIGRLPHERQAQHTPCTKDILAILAACKRDERVFLQAYLQTGARRGEVFRWTWLEDINFDRREVRLGTRKTRDGSMEYEWLPMSDDLYDELWWWWNNRPLKDSPYVFPSTGKGPGNHYGGMYVERRHFLSTLCDRAGVQYFGYHGLRRYVASVLADTHKISSKTIQRILRHKNVTTTERYIKSINSDLGSVVNLLSEKGSHEGLPNNTKGLGNES